MRVEEIIQQWYRIASGGQISTGDVFFRFVAVWVAFNALYTSRHSDEVGDWDQVRAFAGEPEAIDRHRELLRSDSAYSDAVEALKERGVGNSRGIDRRIRDVRNLTQVCSCLYQVRCNLFHGGKLPGNPRDERLVEASYQVVSKLIEPYLVGIAQGASWSVPW